MKLKILTRFAALFLIAALFSFPVRAAAADRFPVTYLLPEGAVNAPENPESLPVPLDKPVPLHAPTLTGHTFYGWKDAWGEYADAVSGDPARWTYTAEFIPNRYRILYVLTTRPGRSFIQVNNKMNPQSYTYGFSAPIQGVWPPSGYLFCGWFLDPDFREGPVSEIAPGTFGDVTLYAKWLTNEEADAEQIRQEGWGDLDGDGAVSAADARLALRQSVGLEHLSPETVARADLAKKGKLDAADARTLLRVSVGLVDFAALLREFGYLTQPIGVGRN
ncbi:MAG: InlB B-repeat-containing protein [Clostridia bacterium]|nr:InlB B-repeat-containing protein [Clostridia bacterium]